MGTKEVIEWIHSYLGFDSKIFKEKRCENSYYIRVTGTQKTFNQACKIYYNEDIRCLERKYKTFIDSKRRNICLYTKCSKKMYIKRYFFWRCYTFIGRHS